MGGGLGVREWLLELSPWQTSALPALAPGCIQGLPGTSSLSWRHAPSSHVLGGMNALPGLHADQQSQDLGAQLARENREGDEGGGLGI